MAYDINKTRYSAYNYKRLLPYLDAVDNRPGEEMHFRFTSGGYMPLVIENLQYTFKGYPVYSMTHYGEMNGDAIRDPDMTFLVDRKSGNIVPHTFQQDCCPFTKHGTLYQEVWPDEQHFRPKLRSELDRFLKDWISNILSQGFSPDQARNASITLDQFAAMYAAQ